MATKMMSPNTTLWWIRGSALSTPTAPKVADLTAAITAGTAFNFSRAVRAGYTLNSTGSDTQSSASITDEGAGQSKGNSNYNGLIAFFREADPETNNDSIYLAAYEEFKVKGVFGYWLRRIGKKNTEALAVGDLLDVYYFQSWTPRVTTDNSSGPIGFTVPFLQQGFMRTNVAAVA